MPVHCNGSHNACNAAPANAATANTDVSISEEMDANAASTNWLLVVELMLLTQLL